MVDVEIISEHSLFFYLSSLLFVDLYFLWAWTGEGVIEMNLYISK